MSDETPNVDAPETPVVPTPEDSDRVQPRNIESEMRQSFLDYAMSVIVSRALPDARDGLKPVHRRILYAMSENGMTHTQSYKKSATAVGDVLGKYHPHGDSAIYDAMVRMAQDWSLRYPLVQGQGNFGSIDGDNAAAMRYTEARMAKVAGQMLADIDKDTVDWAPNYDGRLQEPRVLPAAIPNLLVNGVDGIAVGMATKVPPHNMREVCTAAMRVLENPEVSTAELVEIVPGPDFPTGGVMYGRSGPYAAATTGRGRIVVRGLHDIEQVGDRERIVFTEIPYQTNKAAILMHIADLVKDKVIEGISDLRDESDRRGMRMVIDLKRDAVTDVVLNQLWKYTALQTAYNANQIALVHGRPQILGLKALLEVFLDHRRDVLTRRTQFELDKANARLHIVEGLLSAVDHIDRVIEIIRGSDDVEIARESLMVEFGLSELQCKAILDMTLRKLTGLETMALRDEETDLKGKIAKFLEILGDDTVRDAIIMKDLARIIEEFGDDRRTRIEEAEIDVDMEALIPREESIYIYTREGYVKRMPLDAYKEQRRGGKGLKGVKAKEEDIVLGTAVGSSHDTLCMFTNTGRVHWLKGYRVPVGSRQARGKPVQNFIQLEENERVETILAIDGFDHEGEFLLFATKRGLVKRTALSAYGNVRNVGLKAIELREGDELLAVRRIREGQHVILATAKGLSQRFEVSTLNPRGRVSMGQIGMKFKHEGDEVRALAVVEEGKDLFAVTERGYGKRTPEAEYPVRKGPGGTGVISIICNERNGELIALRPVEGDEGFLVVTEGGMVVRSRVGEVRSQSRNTQGVIIARVAEGDRIAVVAVLPPGDVDDEDMDDVPVDPDAPDSETIDAPELAPEGSQAA